MKSRASHSKEFEEEGSHKQFHFSIYNRSTVPFLVRVTNKKLRKPITKRIEAEGWFIYPSTPECKMYIQWFDDPVTSLLDTYILCFILFGFAMLPYAIFTKSMYSLPYVYIFLWAIFVFVVLYFFSRPRSRQRCILTRVPARNMAYKFYLKCSFIEGIFTRSTFYDITCISE